jgi:hypothetical protein
MTDLPPTCSAVNRSQQLFTAAVHGLRAARATVVGGQRFLDVWLFRNPSAALADPTIWRLRPPPAAATVEVSAAVIDGDHVRLTLQGLPDPTRYRLEITPPAAVPFDPLRVHLPVRLRPECPDLGNCFDTTEAPRLPASSPVDDYTARDWRALRQALVELHQRRRPDADLSAADPTITAIELFAHVGDVLHYRLDRVGTEAYLATARHRTSVRRHSRLLDYMLAESVAARTTIHVTVPPAGGSVNVVAGDIVRPAEATSLAFTLEADLAAVDALGEIALYDWGEDGCCLPEGSTSAVLVRPLPADPLGANWLAPGDKLAFEVVDPGNLAVHDAWRARTVATPWPEVAGNPAFRAPLPSRRAQIVELTAVEPIVDPLAPGLPLALVRWGSLDRLERAYPVSVDTTRGAPEVTVARANLVDAHHGLLVDGPADAVLEELRPDWADQPPDDLPGADGPGGGRDRLGWLLVGAPDGLARRADGMPYLLQARVTLASGAQIAADHVDTHLGVTPGVLAVTVEQEDWRPPLLRFSTGGQGAEPPTGSAIDARYEAGGGAAANVPANTLTELAHNTALPGQPPAWVAVTGASARNPVAAAGGTGPEPLARARRGAPQAFAAFPQRAVLPADHAAAARELPGIDRATASRTWTGAWPLIRTVVDLTGSDEQADLAAAIAHLDGLRMLGQEVTVVPGSGVGLVIGLDVCVAPGIDTEAVRREILARLRPGNADAPGLFHPGNLRLGGTIHTSGVITAAAGVHGVDAVEVTTARRLVEPESTVHEVLTFAAHEIPVLDDDPARPERGRIELTMRGGR